ncbi:hypothetical protein TNCV_3808131 [Trichonephila clavipes]|nr:hypothetical protein TNCV_3808131 [Trichonephila clavipes]
MGLSQEPLKTHGAKGADTIKYVEAKTSSSWCGVSVRRGRARSDHKCAILLNIVVVQVTAKKNDSTEGTKVYSMSPLFDQNTSQLWKTDGSTELLHASNTNKQEDINRHAFDICVADHAKNNISSSQDLVSPVHFTVRMKFSAFPSMDSKSGCEEQGRSYRHISRTNDMGPPSYRGPNMCKKIIIKCQKGPNRGPKEF